MIALFTFLGEKNIGTVICSFLYMLLNDREQEINNSKVIKKVNILFNIIDKLT